MASRVHKPGLAVAVLLLSGVAGAQEGRRATAWPASLGVSAMAGAELRGAAGGAASFGFVGEALWRGRIGGFAGLLSTSGLVEPTRSGQSAIPDRISAPFGLVARPFSVLVENRADYLGRFAQGIWLQLGVTVENIRTSDESQTVAGFHGAVGVDVPIWGGPVEGGVLFRVSYRMVAAKEVHLHASDPTQLFSPNFSSQIFAGLAYFP